MTTPTLPPCVLAMRCYCAAHAMGAPSYAPCNADEDSAREEWGKPQRTEEEEEFYRETHCVDCDQINEECECDPTPYETGEPDNLPREAQERAAESMRMRR